MVSKQNPTEQRDAEMHRRIAARIRREPGVIAETRQRLTDAMAQGAPYADPVLCDWLDVLLMLDPGQIAVMLKRGLVELATLRERILQTADLHMRAILSARLQIVLESADR